MSKPAKRQANDVASADPFDPVAAAAAAGLFAPTGPCEHGCEADNIWRDECSVHGPPPEKIIVGDCSSGCATSQVKDKRCNVHGFYMFRDDLHRTA